MKNRNKLVTMLIFCLLVLNGCRNTEYEVKKLRNKEEIKYSKSKLVGMTHEKYSDSYRIFGNSVNNFQNKIHASKYNDRIYYCGKDIRGVYSVELSGENEKKINNDRATFINVYKDRLYYINNSGNNNTELISVKLDGKTDRRVISENVDQVLIKNDNLVYVTSLKCLMGKIPAYVGCNMISYGLNKNGEKKIFDAGYGSSVIIDEKTVLASSPIIENYISVNGKKIYPQCYKNHPKIQFLGSHENYIVVLLDKSTDNVDNQVCAIEKDGACYKIIPCKDVKSKILVGKKFYYYKFNDFMCFNLENGRKTKLFEYVYKDSDLFDFEGIIYTRINNKFIAMYDTNKKKVTDEFSNYLEKKIDN
ncbi:hypothetical protein C3495_03200 [Clostridiaceae bacterium 14S0207]|nr:hypothetical protein C3495_03200 [Clostridiaceae bacterium 14S0207]